MDKSSHQDTPFFYFFFVHAYRAYAACTGCSSLSTQPVPPAKRRSSSWLLSRRQCFSTSRPEFVNHREGGILRNHSLSSSACDVEQWQMLYRSGCPFEDVSNGLWEIVEGQELLLILFQRCACLRIFCFKECQEQIKDIQCFTLA